MSEILVSDIIDTRSNILQSAIKLFVAQSYDSVGIRQISQESGCHMGAVSYHFGGKEGLFEECVNGLDKKAFLELCDKLDASFDDTTEFESFFVNFLLLTGQFCQKNRLVLTLQIREFYSQTPRIKDIKDKFYLPFYSKLEEFFSYHQKNGVLRGDLNTSFFVRSVLIFIQNEFILYQRTETQMQIVANEFMKICNRSIYES